MKIKEIKYGIKANNNDNNNNAEKLVKNSIQKKTPAILTAAMQFVIYRVAQKSKLQFFPNLHQIVKLLCEI